MVDAPEASSSSAPDWTSLRQQIQGKVIVLGADNSFFDHFVVFNSANRPSRSSNNLPKAIVFPLTTRDVSAIVRFSHDAKLTLSVKSGGYNPSNWACSGQIVLDLGEMNHLEMTLPSQHVNYDSLPKDSSALSPPEIVGNHATVYGRGVGPAQNITPKLASEAQVSMDGVIPASPTSSSFNAKGKRRRTDDEQPVGEGASGSSEAATGHAHNENKLSNGTQAARSDEVHMSSAENFGHSATANGKRRQLDDSGSSANVSYDTSAVRDAPMAAMPEACGPTNDRPLGSYLGESVSHQLDQKGRHGADAGPSTVPSNIIVSSTYPAQYLTTADIENSEVLAQYHGDSSQAGGAGSPKIRPISYDAQTRQIRMPEPAPPGAIPFSVNTASIAAGTNTSSSASGSGSRNRQTSTSYNVYHGAPGTHTPDTSRSSGSPLEAAAFGVSADAPSISVTFGSGIRAKELDAFTSPHGYFVPLACYPVGTAIFTTGGYGFVSRLFGLSMDLTEELEIVLPDDGRVVTLREDFKTDPSLSEAERAEQAELWWACRGAGTAFGIVTRIKAKAYRIGSVLSGNLIYPFNPATAPSLIRHWRDCLKAAPKELYANITLTAGPATMGHVIVIQFSWCGTSQSDGEIILQAILAWDGERCLLKDVEVRPYSHQQENVAQILSSKENTRWLVRSTLVSSLTDDAVHKTVECFRDVPAGTSWLIELAGGAIADPQHETCFPTQHRRAPFQMAALHQWIDPKEDQHNKTAAERWIYESFDGQALGPFPCFIASGEGKNRMVLSYGEDNWSRLVELKKKYDPRGLLRYTHFERELSHAAHVDI